MLPFIIKNIKVKKRAKIICNVNDYVIKPIIFINS